jgi:hypothetical protein
LTGLVTTGEAGSFVQKTGDTMSGNLTVETDATYAVRGRNTGTGDNHGGYFATVSAIGYGLVATNESVGSYAKLATNGPNGVDAYGSLRGVYAAGGSYGIEATGTSYGVDGFSDSGKGIQGRSNSGWGGFFTGGDGLYASKLHVGNAASPVVYNRIGGGSATHTSSGQIETVSDLFIGGDLEVDEDVWIDINLTVAGSLESNNALISNLDVSTLEVSDLNVTNSLEAVGALVSGNLDVGGDIYSTAWTDYSDDASPSGWSSPTKKVYYKKIGKTIFVAFNISGTSNSGFATFSLAHANSASIEVNAVGRGIDGGTALEDPILIFMNTSTSTVNLYKTLTQETESWTNSDTKAVRGQFWYETN